jgi:hypothetical protein
MPRFRTLSEAIRTQVAEYAPRLDVAVGTPLAAQLAQNLANTLSDDPQSGVLRWGSSTWGIEPVIGLPFPESPDT